MDEVRRPDSAQRAAERTAYFLLKRVWRGVRDFSMLHPGDRVAVALSGGKDSLALLRLLQLGQRTWGIPFELAAIHVSADGRGPLPPHGPLLDWMASHAAGVPFQRVDAGIPPGEPLPMPCHRCARLRRKALFEAAAQMGYHVLAYAHHADDAAQTALLNLLYGGTARTLAPAADYFGGQFRLVRPLFYVPESDLRRLARLSAFPEPPPACPRGSTSRRAVAAQMLRLLGRDYLTQARPNLLRAGLDRPDGEPAD